jgi:hypothetical protein
MKDNIERFEIRDYVDINSKNTDYLDLDNKYRILVPLNDKATECLYGYDIYENGEIRSDIVGIEFHEDTFYYMENRLFDFINVECDLLINMYEEEVLENNQLDKAMNITQIIIDNTDDEALLDFAHKLLRLMNLAKESGTVVGFYF